MPPFFLYPAFLWGATTIGGLVVAMILSQTSDPEEHKAWTFAFMAFFLMMVVLSPFGPVGP